MITCSFDSRQLRATSASYPTRSTQEAANLRSSYSVRAPSATLALVLTGQLQFLATLSLVNSTGDADSLVSHFADNLRYDASVIYAHQTKATVG